MTTKQMTTTEQPTEQASTEQPESPDSTSDRLLPENWPVSNNFILVAILLLLATALAVVVSTEDVANRFAGYAYYFLTVGVLIRIVEQTVGDRVASHGQVLFSKLDEALARRIRCIAENESEAKARSRLRPAQQRYISPLVKRLRSTLVYLRERNAAGVCKVTAIGVFLGGGIQLVLWWRQPLTYVSSTYVIGWVFVLTTLTGGYFLLK